MAVLYQGAESQDTFRGLSFLYPPFTVLWKYRVLLAQTVLADMKTRCAGSLMGMSWLILYPLLLLGAYAFIYIAVFNVRPSGESASQYLVLIFSGLVPFLGFSEALQAGIPSLTNNAHLVKNSLYPVEMIPVKAVFVGQMKQVVGVAVLVALLATTGNLGWHALLLGPIWICQVLLMIGMAWILSSVNTYVRDIQNAAGLITMFLLMVSPIAYTSEMVPASLRVVVSLNPIYYVITPWQNVLAQGVMPKPEVMVVLAIQSLVAFVGGYWLFARLRSVLVDHV